VIWSESLSVKIINKDGKVMEIIKIIGIALIALIIIIMLKQYRPEYAIFISILTGILILFLVMDRLTGIINLIETIQDKFSINTQFIALLIKITGIAFLSEFAVSVCKDSGEAAIASKIEIGSKIIIISMSIPIISSLLEIILKILP
jgi:stage III sporulation protein AD